MFLIAGAIVLAKDFELESNLVWIDLEMTGLDPERHVILEIACIITDNMLDIVAEGPNIAINHPDRTLSLMDAWSREHHQISGLLDKSKDSPCNCRMAEKEVLDFLSKYCSKGMSPLCGNSVWQDRRFLIKYMPDLEDFLNYRNIDISSIKELAKRWYPALPHFKKTKQHLAMDDIRESIKELNFYRKHIFTCGGDHIVIRQNQEDVSGKSWLIPD
ncbi:MAG: oligoribonuclease [Deltaproteobacteria bacterium]|nr:oligoribonuclease [Deltaproteobacteria bacterium]